MRLVSINNQKWIRNSVGLVFFTGKSRIGPGFQTKCTFFGGANNDMRKYLFTYWFSQQTGAVKYFAFYALSRKYVGPVLQNSKRFWFILQKKKPTNQPVFWNFTIFLMKPYRLSENIKLQNFFNTRHIKCEDTSEYFQVSMCAIWRHDYVPC